MSARLQFKCTSEDFLPQDPCEARQVTLDEWRRFGHVWGIYSDWGPQEGDIDSLGKKGFSLFVLFDTGQAVACAGRLPRSERDAEIDSVWVSPSHRKKGFGRKIVAFVTSAILGDGKTVLYRTASDNVASARVAEEVGFKRINSTGSISRP